MTVSVCIFKRMIFIILEMLYLDICRGLIMLLMAQLTNALKRVTFEFET